MAKPAVSIIGAGLGGLVLGRSLLRQGIITTIYDKAPQGPRHNYAITLQPSSYIPLLKLLDLDDELSFRKHVAVDANVGGIGNLAPGPGFEPCSFRANRSRLERFLSQGLDIRWKHELQSIVSQHQCSSLMRFENEQQFASDIIFSAEGPHSCLRTQYFPSVKPEILPFVVFNGKRQIERTLFDDIYAAAMKTSTVLQVKQGRTVLSISLNDIDDSCANLSWNYSRPAHGPLDSLHRPDRSTSEAKSTPDLLFQEINALPALPQPFSDMFKDDTLRRDRILHWLMRTLLVPLDGLQELAKDKIWFLGDAVHAEQIVGGNGANSAILDALSLAEHVRVNGLDLVDSWYALRYSSWEQGQKNSLESILAIHDNDGGL